MSLSIKFNTKKALQICALHFCKRQICTFRPHVPLLHKASAVASFVSSRSFSSRLPVSLNSNDKSIRQDNLTNQQMASLPNNSASAAAADISNESKRPLKFHKKIDAVPTRYNLAYAMSTSKSYNMLKLPESLDKSRFRVTDLVIAAEIQPENQPAIHAYLIDEQQGKDNEGEVFFFKEGVFVCWNVEPTRLKEIRNSLRPIEEGSIDDALVKAETEEFAYQLTNRTDIQDEMILFDKNTDEKTHALEKFAFSNGMALSVKLAISETTLKEFAARTDEFPKMMKEGKKLKISLHDARSLTGELIMLRNSVFLQSDTLLPPDYYWDRPNLEDIYKKMRKVLEIPSRTNAVEHRLTVCKDQVEAINADLRHQHGARLEWYIIILISIEILLFFLDVYKEELSGKAKERDILISETLQAINQHLSKSSKSKDEKI